MGERVDDKGLLQREWANLEDKHEVVSLLKKQLAENARLEAELKRLAAEVAAMRGKTPKE